MAVQGIIFRPMARQKRHGGSSWLRKAVYLQETSREKKRESERERGRERGRERTETHPSS